MEPAYLNLILKQKSHGLEIPQKKWVEANNRKYVKIDKLLRFLWGKIVTRILFPNKNFRNKKKGMVARNDYNSTELSENEKAMGHVDTVHFNGSMW